MLLEAVDHPIRYRFSGGEIRLEPGRPVEVEPERAAKLLARAGAKVRAVESANRTKGDLTGRIVTWESPLFGLLRATVLQDLRNGVLVFHPLTERDCVIPMTWLRPHVNTVIPNQPLTRGSSSQCGP